MTQQELALPFQSPHNTSTGLKNFLIRAFGSVFEIYSTDNFLLHTVACEEKFCCSNKIESGTFNKDLTGIC